MSSFPFHWLRLAIFPLVFVGRSGATEYHLDSLAGDDAHDGISPDQAWKSLAKVNAHEFKPGDRLKLKADGVWSGVLHPLGSGVVGSPIHLESYGNGAKPLVNGGGVEAAVFLLNQSYWEIQDIEVTNHGLARGEYAGIKVRNNSGAAGNSVSIRGCFVHDVNGITSGYYGTNVGIAVVADMNGSYWNDVMIENNGVKTADRMGIFIGPTRQLHSPNEWLTLPKSNHVTIQDNTITDSGGDAILNFVTNDTLIQHNVVADGGARASDGSANKTGYANKYSAGIWSAIATKTVIQYNEVYGEQTTFDGEGYDVDLGSDDIAVQFNYSHHNRGGFLLFCESGSRADINDAKIRFNVSHDDHRGVFVFCQVGLSPGPIPTQINNNTIYLPKDSNTPVFIYSGGTLTGKMNVYNNLFYVLGPTSYCEFSGPTFDHNLFFGDHPETEPNDPDKLTDDPRLLNPGAAAIGRSSTDGYQLREGSPALGRGRYSTAEAMGDKDYWGNPVRADYPINIGAYNGLGLNLPEANLAVNATILASSSSEQGTWSKSRAVDGQTRSTLGTSGYSSETGVTVDHREWFIVDLGKSHEVSAVVLFPRSTPNFLGKGFPRTFEIQTWDGTKWVSQYKGEKYPNPGDKAQTFKFQKSATTTKVRLVCTKLDQLGKDFVLQLAEIQVLP